MTHVLTDAGITRATIGTNATIEQRFAAMMAGRRPRGPNILYLDAALEAAQIGAYSGVVDTPHIDRLARSGVRFTAASAEGAHGALVPELLRERGYDDGVFRPAGDTDDRLDVEPVMSFIGARRPAPLVAYVRLGASRPEPVDVAIGRLVHALRRTGNYRRTVVAFVGSERPGDSRVPTVLSWPGQIPPRQRHDGRVGAGDLVPTLVEAAVPGGSSGLALDGIDLTSHLFDGAPMPERPARRVGGGCAA